MSKALIIGSEGFIGTHMKEALPDADCLDLTLGQDIRDFKFEGKYDIIYLMAAQASIPASFKNPIFSHENNVLGTIRVLEFARKTGAKVVFSSSSSVYGDAEMPTEEGHIKNPQSPYAVQKLNCEDYLKMYWKRGVKSCALRYFNVFGEGQENANAGDSSLLLATFLQQYKDKEPFTIVGTGEQRRDFVYVKDVVKANLLSDKFLDKTKHFNAFNIGSGVNYSVNDVADMINKKHPRINLPKRDEPFANQANIRRAEILLKWHPHKTLRQWLYNVK